MRFTASLAGRLLQLIALFALATGSARAEARLSCVLGSVAPPEDVKEIQSSCDGLLVEQDSTRLIHQAWGECCRLAGDYVRKQPIPPRAPGDRTDDSWTRYRIRLALDVCDGIKEPDLTYQRNLCLTEMLFRIPDPRVSGILRECSPIAHSPRSGGRHRHASAQSARKDLKLHAPDLLLGDEAFSKCRHEKLEALLADIESGARGAKRRAGTPSEETSGRRNTSASPHSARTTE